MTAQAEVREQCAREDRTALALCILHACDRIELAMRALDRRGLLDEEWREQLRYDLGELRRVGERLKRTEEG